MKKIIISALIVSIFTFGCTKQDQGLVFGGAAGALAGSALGKGRGRAVGAGIGALIGGLVGSKVGQYMDEQDKMKANITTQKSLEYSKSGSSSTWRNPDSRHHGTVTPYQAYQDNTGRYCREYVQTVTISGETQKAYGTACRQPDGSWQVVK